MEVLLVVVPSCPELSYPRPPSRPSTFSVTPDLLEEVETLSIDAFLMKD